MTDCNWHDESSARRLGAAETTGPGPFRGRRRAWLTATALMLAWLATVAIALQEQTRERFGGDWIDEVYLEAIEGLERGAGIVLAEPVEVLLLTMEEATQRRLEYAGRMDEHGGMTKGAELIADFMFGENLLGRYVPDEKVVYIIEDVMKKRSFGDPDAGRELIFTIMAHELVHAYDDQTYGVLLSTADLPDAIESPDQIMDLNTMMGLVEGRATYAAELAAKAVGREPMEPPTVEDAEDFSVFGGDDALTRAGAGIGNAVARMKYLQYVWGREFAKAAFEFGGEPFFRHVFDSLPLTEAELKDFEKFKVRWAEELEASFEEDEEAL